MLLNIFFIPFLSFVVFHFLTLLFSLQLVIFSSFSFLFGNKYFWFYFSPSFFSPLSDPCSVLAQFRCTRHGRTRQWYFRWCTYAHLYLQYFYFLFYLTTSFNFILLLYSSLFVLFLFCYFVLLLYLYVRFKYYLCVRVCVHTCMYTWSYTYILYLCTFHLTCIHVFQLICM